MNTENSSKVEKKKKKKIKVAVNKNTFFFQTVFFS